jgi:hypothetical protein
MEPIRSKESSMDNVVVRKVKDLDNEVRVWVCSLFGRELRDDEEVAVALPDAAGQVNGDRAQARRKLLSSMEQLSERFKDVPDDEMEAVLDEAMKSVRPSFESRP